MSRVVIRYALPKDAPRLVADGVVGGALPPGQTWDERVRLWLAEQQAGRRLVLVAEDPSGLLGAVMLVFRLPEGYHDPEAANGFDIAMIEGLKLRAGAPPGTATQLVTDAQALARKKGVSTITFLIRLDDDRGIAQVKSWGFQEFRIMPERGGMYAFFRKSVA